MSHNAQNLQSQHDSKSASEQTASNNRAPRRSRLRHVQRPWLSGVFFLLLAADVAAALHFYTWSGAKNNITTTTIPWYVTKYLLKTKVPDVEFVYPWSGYFVLDNGVYRDLDTMRQSADELTKLLASRPADVIEIKRSRFVGRRGTWAPTAEVHEHRLKITRMSDGARMDADPAARAAYATATFGKRDPELDRLVRADILEYRRIWSGYAHDAAMLLVLALFVVSLGWVPRLWGARRRERLLLRGICPKCAYDLSGTVPINGSKSCPECGTTWPLPAPPA